mgnify:CR=1 FL=1
MTKESCDYLEIAFKSIQCFASDGKLLVDELEELVKIALRDGVVDDNEKRVLGEIISRLTPSELTADMEAKVQEIKEKILS